MATTGQSAVQSLTFTGPSPSNAYTVLESGTGFTGLQAGTGVALLVAGAAAIEWTGVSAAQSV
jgi:hypothetical protein